MSSALLATYDHPGLILVSQPLNDANYSKWKRKRSMILALLAKRKLGMINGTYPKPSSGSAYRDRCNDMVISWLLNSLIPEMVSSVVYSPTAREIWTNLEIRSTQTNRPKLFQLKKGIGDLTQGNLSITSYYTKFKVLREELHNLIGAYLFSSKLNIQV